MSNESYSLEQIERAYIIAREIERTVDDPRRNFENSELYRKAQKDLERVKKLFESIPEELLRDLFGRLLVNEKIGWLQELLDNYDIKNNTHAMPNWAGYVQSRLRNK